MALLWIEGFEGYGSYAGFACDTYVERKYPYRVSAGILYLRDGRTGGWSCQSNSTSAVIHTPYLTNADTLIVGCAIKPVTAGVDYIFSLYDRSTSGVNLRYDSSTGEITAYRSSTVLGTTSGAALTLSNWSYVEAKIKCHDSLGTVDIKVGSVVRLSLTNQNTQPGTNAYHDRVGIRLSSHCYVDDFYVCDNTGSFNNDWIGIRKVVGLFPNEDSGTLQWTPSTGTSHYDLVNEATEGGAYIYDGTAGDTDLWGYQDISDVGEINGIQINTSCRETAAESFDLITPIKSGGVTYDDAGIPIGTTDTQTISRAVGTDPDTDALWTIEGLNSSQIGVKLG